MICLPRWSLSFNNRRKIHEYKKIFLSQSGQQRGLGYPGSRVARWFIFEPKIPIWVNFGGLGLENFNIFNGHLEYFMDICDIL
jgi:hypothetical protein